MVVRRLILAAAALTAALCSLPAASTAGRAERTVVLISRCHTSELAVSLGRMEAGLGNVGVNVYLRNRSAPTCFVFGYVGFRLRDRHRRRQPSRVRWGNTYFQIDPRPHRVVLRPGARAVANLAWTANPLPGERQNGPCEPTSSWLEVTPPEERASRLVRFGAVVCGHGALASAALTATGTTIAGDARLPRVTNRCPANALPLRPADLPALRRFALRLAPHGVQKEGSHSIDYRDATAKGKFPTFYTGYVRSVCRPSFVKRVIARTANVAVGYPHVDWSASLSYSVFLIVRTPDGFVGSAQMH